MVSEDTKKMVLAVMVNSMVKGSNGDKVVIQELFSDEDMAKIADLARKLNENNKG